MIDVRRSIVLAVAAERRQKLAELAAARAADSDLLDQVIAEKNRMHEKLTETRHWFDSQIAALRAELRAAHAELHKLRLINMFADVQRDWGKPLQ